MKRWTAVSLLLVGMILGGLLTHSVLQGQAVVPPAIPKEMTSYRDIVKQVLPAVVSIDARGKPQPPPRRRGSDFGTENRQQQFEAQPRQGFGSGVVIDPTGVILTNYHVIEGATEAVVQFADGKKVTSKDIKGDPKSDLAIVRVKMPGAIPALPLGDSEKMEIGDRVLAVGAPFGLTGSVTHGIISGKGRSLKLNLYEDFLQTDAAINPGNSGGPLINLAGEVIGINAAIKSRSGGFQGVGLAVASNLAKDVLKKLVKDGVVKRGYLGVQINDLDETLAARLSLPKEQKGVVVSRLLDGGPAEKAGLKEGDVIHTIDGQALADGKDMQRIVADLTLNKPVKMHILRDGKARVLEVTIEEQPAELGQ